MSDAVEKLSGKLGIDATDFKTALGAANRELRVLESGFKASAASLGDWAQSATGLESRIKTLTSQMDIQKLKVAALREEHTRLVAANGENSRAAQDAEIKLNQETERLNKMGAELNTTTGALDEMKAGSNEAGDSVEQLGNDAATSEKKLFSFKDILGGIGAAGKAAVVGIVALGTAAVATVGLLAGLALNTASTAEKLADLSNQTGISTTRLQEMQYAGKILGTSLETITGAQAKMIRSMASGADGTGAQADAFKELGVATTDANGNLRDSQTVFAETIDALGKISNPTERDALSMQIFGKSAQELNPLIKAGSAELAKLSEEAHKMGAVMSEEDVAAASAFKDQLDGLKMGFQGVVAQIGLAFIPGLSGLATTAKGYLQELVQIVQGSGGDVGKMAQGMGALFGKIVTDLAKQAPQMLQVGLTLIKSVLTSITANLPQMLKAAQEILKSLVKFIADALPVIIPAALSILLMLVNAFVGNLPMLIDAATKAIVTLALGLSQALPTLVPAIIQAMLTIVDTLVKNLPMLINAALLLLIALAQGIAAALPILVQQGPVIMDALQQALIASLPLILAAAGLIVYTLLDGIAKSMGGSMAEIKATWDANWNQLGEITSKIGTQISTNWTNNGNQLAEITGKIGTQISTNWSNNWNQLGEIVDKALAIIKTNVDAKINDIKNIFTKAKNSLFSAGSDMIAGFENGVNEAFKSLLINLGDLIDLLPQVIKDALGIASPSKVGISIGKNFISSIGLGGQQAMPDISRAFAGMANQMALATARSSVTPLGNGYGEVNSEYNAYYAPVTQIVSSKTAAATEDAAKGRRF